MHKVCWLSEKTPTNINNYKDIFSVLHWVGGNIPSNGIVTFSPGILQQVITIPSAFLEVNQSFPVLLSGAIAHVNLNLAQVSIAIVDNNGSRQALIGICVHKSLYLQHLLS